MYPLGEFHPKQTKAACVRLGSPFTMASMYIASYSLVPRLSVGDTGLMLVSQVRLSLALGESLTCEAN